MYIIYIYIYIYTYIYIYIHTSTRLPVTYMCVQQLPSYYQIVHSEKSAVLAHSLRARTLEGGFHRQPFEVRSDQVERKHLKLTSSGCDKASCLCDFVATLD